MVPQQRSRFSTATVQHRIRTSEESIYDEELKSAIECKTFFNPEGTPPFTVVVTHCKPISRSAGLVVAPKSARKKKSKNLNNGYGLSFFTVGVLLIIGIYHIVLYFQRRRRYNWCFYFGLFCLNLAVREALVQKYLLLLTEISSANHLHTPS